MNQQKCDFRIKLKSDAQGKITIKSDNIAIGLVVFLMGFFSAGLFFAMIVGFEWPSLWREPVHIDLTKWNQQTEAINRQMRKIDSNFTPLPNLPPGVQDDPGGFEWGVFGLLFDNSRDHCWRSHCGPSWRSNHVHGN